ncbi:hypothetical protein [Methylocystis parvus]|uniref:hypothetical protein n=1 Tax=Methylocystis parvus TaxID=134 RepID=UPI003C7115DE
MAELEARASLKGEKPKQAASGVFDDIRHNREMQHGLMRDQINANARAAQQAVLPQPQQGAF